MCDLFWVSPGNQQGDLSDVVRASLHHHLPTPGYLQPEEEHESSLLLEGGGGIAGGHGDGQLAGMMGGNTRPSCDHHALLHHPPSTTTYPQPQPLAGMIREMSRLPPQLRRLGGTDVERGGDVVAPPEMTIGDHLQQMSMHAHVPAIKRSSCRKSQTRKVVCIPAPTAAGRRPSTSGGEVVPSDLWAWRKYGQKPIKGSPYPRGYYRCSSSKGCPARKQVERSRTDPTMLVVTYTSDHNHPWPTQRNALAGSTRPSAAAKSHTSSSSLAAAAGPAYGNTNGSASAHHHQLKQEVLDADLDLLADMDALNIFSKINNEDNTKEQLQLDPFSSSFLDYWTSFGDADNN